MVTCGAENFESVGPMGAGSSVAIFAQLIQTLFAAQCLIMKRDMYPADRTAEVLDDLDFDFVIVGGGSAGSVVASRLSEIPRWRVLLIEAGNDPSIQSDIPIFLTSLQNTKEDYGYVVEASGKYCQDMKGKQCVWSKGKALGGSSVINAMLYVRGADRDYDRWAETVGKDWSFENVLPYFRRIENYHPEVVAKHGEGILGTGGPLTIRSYNYSRISDVHEMISDAAAELGYERIEMINTGKYVGFGNLYGSISEGLRVNVAKAYLGPANARGNLYVMKSAKVTRLMLSDDNRATGVEVLLEDGRLVYPKASKEVIVSAGTIASPHLLMLSGIGPREELEPHGIDVVADLPVGKNLQDHLIWPGMFFSYVNESSEIMSTKYMLDSSYEYLLHRTGFIASAGGLDYNGFINTRNSSAKYPNIQIYFPHVPVNQPLTIDSFNNAFKMSEASIRQLKKLNEKSNIVMVLPSLLDPLSTGQLKLRSADPDDQIKIYANYFEEQEDLNALVKSIETIRSLANTTALRKFGFELHYLQFPECNEYTDDEDLWPCLIKYTTTTVYHPVGTCKMGPKSDREAVVDPQLRVHGVKGLRVIDASIMPRVTTGNTNAPTIMIGEKGSDFIKRDWLHKTEL